MDKKINALNVNGIANFNEEAALSETNTLRNTTKVFIREKGIYREINAADICDKITTDDLYNEREYTDRSDKIKPLFRLYDASKLIFREIMAALRGCDEHIAECIGSNTIMIAAGSEKKASGASRTRGNAKIKKEQEDLMIKEAEKKNANGSLMLTMVLILLTAIGGTTVWACTFLAYLCAGISLYASLKNTEGKSKTFLVVSNVIVLAGAFICHAIQSLSL